MKLSDTAIVTQAGRVNMNSGRGISFSWVQVCPLLCAVLLPCDHQDCQAENTIVLLDIQFNLMWVSFRG